MTIFLIALLVIAVAGVAASVLAVVRDGYRRTPRRLASGAGCPNERWSAV
jgi:hypothetical protein